MPQVMKHLPAFAKRKAPAVHALLICCMIVAGLCAPGRADAVEVCSAGELNNAAASAGPGSDIVMCDQVWRDTQIKIRANGSAASPIRLRAHTPGQVFLEGNSAIQISGSYIVIDGLVFKGPTNSDRAALTFYTSDGQTCRNCRLTNSAIIDFTYPNPHLRKNWVAIRGQDNKVDHNYFSGKTNLDAVVLVKRDNPTADRATISRNYFSRPPAAESNGGECIRVGQEDGSGISLSDSSTMIEENYFYKADGEIEMISLKSSGNTVRRNTVDSSRGTISIRQGRRNRIDGNIILGYDVPGTGGIRMTGEDHIIVNNYISRIRPDGDARGGIVLLSGDAAKNYPPVRNVLVAFNTIVDSDRSMVFGADNRSSAPANITLANNVIRTSKAPMITQKQALVSSSFDKNIMYGAELGIPMRTGLTLEDPRLQADGENIQRPSSSSPLLRFASANYGVTSDMDGQARSTDSDAGADQHDSGSVAQKPISLCDVGPLTWSPADCGSRPAPPSDLSIQ